MDIQQLYNKYNNFTNFSFDEFKNDLGQIKPLYKPIIDICIMKSIGNLVDKMLNLKKWNSCPNLKNEIIDMTKQKFPLLISEETISSIYNEAMQTNKTPSNAIDNIYYKVSDDLKSNIKSDQDIKQYFDTKNLYDEQLRQIKLKYQDTWDQLDNDFEQLNDIIIENFEELENNAFFEETIELIEKINDEASVQVKQLIELTRNLLKKEFLLTKEIKGVTSNHIFEKIKKDLLIEFNNEMDQIYSNVIASKKFDKSIEFMFLELYDVEKSMHRLSLTFDYGSDFINYAINIQQTVTDQV